MSSIGSVNPAVLPVPVCATPSDITRHQDDGDRLFLNRGRVTIAHVVDRAQDFGGQAEIGEHRARRRFFVGGEMRGVSGIVVGARRPSSASPASSSAPTSSASASSASTSSASASFVASNTVSSGEVLFAEESEPDVSAAA